MAECGRGPEGEADVLYRNVYFPAPPGWPGRWIRVARQDLGPEMPAVRELLSSLVEGYVGDPELVDIAPGPGPAVSLLFGESGIRLAAHAAGATTDLEGLAACIARGRECPTRELCWGSPGTMTAALALWRSTGESRWRELWLDSAEWLIGEWEDPIWMQELYGKTPRLVGAGHGFAGNAAALLAGADLLADQAPAIARRCANVLSALAIERDGLAQWPPGFGEGSSTRSSGATGAPGMVISLASLPAEPRTDALLIAGGELTWTAGALNKGPGLCHGTAGNAYGLLALHARTGDELWLARARSFAMDAIADVRGRREARGRGRYSLFTGDIGVCPVPRRLRAR